MARKIHAQVEALSSIHFKFQQDLALLIKQEEENENGRRSSGEVSTLGTIVKEKLVAELDVYRDYVRQFEEFREFTNRKTFRKFLEAEVFLLSVLS